jgi:hypothetical protein
VSTRGALGAAAERSRVGLRARAERLRALGPTLLLGAVAVGSSWLVARELFGQRGAFFAPIAAVITLGLTIGQRLQRAVEMCVGVALGILFADVAVMLIGAGPAQLMLITFAAMSAAVLLGGGPLLVTQAAVSAILVVTLQPPTDGFNFTREWAALIGCGTVLLLNFVVAPIDPVRLVRREAEPVLRELSAVLADVAAALDGRDRDAAVGALERARAIDVHTQRFMEALTIGRETAAAAPQRHAAREPLAIYSEAGGQLDLAVRNVRVLARGAIRAIDVGDRVPPEVGRAIRELGEAVDGVGPWLHDVEHADAARDAAVRAARTASAVLEQTSNLSVSVMVGQIRSTAVDLLRSTGLTPADARALVRGGVPEAI